MPSDVLSTKERKLKSAYSYVILLSSSTYKIKVTVGTETTVMYPIVSLIDSGATTTLINEAFVNRNGKTA